MAYTLHVLGAVDYSMCCPCVCIFTGGAVFNYESCIFFYLTDTKKYAQKFNGNIHGKLFSEWEEEMERYCSIADWAMDILKGCSQVAIEGYAFGATGKIFNIAENTCILKYKLYQEGIPTTIIPPTENKKLFCGRGNGDKNAMHDAFLAETGINLKLILTPNKQDSVSPVSDIVDSYALCKILHSQVILNSI
jgi:hypothetical protein